MKLEKLTRLFSALNPSTPEIQEKSEQIAKSQAQASTQGTEAVKVSSSFGYADDSSGESRAAKVARLKQAVQEGSYRPDTREVAKAVINDLFA